MPKPTLPQELDHLVDLISLHDDGIGIDALLQALNDQIPRRTLQCRLALLIDQGRIQSSGGSRALRYMRSQMVPEVSNGNQVTTAARKKLPPI